MKGNKKKNQRSLKKERGITLVALVITIVILIILATVAINFVFGNTGIITRAQVAAEETRGARVEEERDLWNANQYLNDYIPTTSESLTDLINRLVNQGLLKENEKDQILGKEKKGIEATRQVAIGSKIIIFGTEKMTLAGMLKKAEADGCMNLDGTCNNPNHLHIGDYVDYKNPESGIYTISGEKSGTTYDQTYSITKNQLNWRVLGIDIQTGGLKLIAGSPMKLNSTDQQEQVGLCLRGAEAYVYGPEEMDRACEMYKNNYAIEARSVKIEDINQVLGIKEEQIKEYNMFPAFDFLQYGESFNYLNQYTPESWIDGKEASEIAGRVTGYGYIVGDEQIEGAPVKIVTMTNTRAKSMLFDNVYSTGGKAYWLASRGINALSEYAQYGPGQVSYMEHGELIVQTGVHTFESTGSEDYWAESVRPVVVLKDSVTEEQISRIPDKVESAW